MLQAAELWSFIQALFVNCNYHTRIVFDSIHLSNILDMYLSLTSKRVRFEVFFMEGGGGESFRCEHVRFRLENHQTTENDNTC